MNKKLFVLPAFFLYAFGLFRLMDKDAKFMRKETPDDILRCVFLYGGPERHMNFTLYFFLVCVCFCAAVFISSEVYNISRGNMRLRFIRLKGRAKSLAYITRLCVRSAAAVIVSVIAGLAAGTAAAGLIGKISLSLCLGAAILSISYLMFLTGLTVICFVIKQITGDYMAIAVTMAVISAAVLLDYYTGFFAMLTAGSTAQSLWGLSLSAAWAAACYCTAVRRIKKIDLA